MQTDMTGSEPGQAKTTTLPPHQKSCWLRPPEATFVPTGQVTDGAWCEACRNGRKQRLETGGLGRFSNLRDVIGHRQDRIGHEAPERDT